MKDIRSFDWSFCTALSIIDLQRKGSSLQISTLVHRQIYQFEKSFSSFYVLGNMAILPIFINPSTRQ